MTSTHTPKTMFYSIPDLGANQTITFTPVKGEPLSFGPKDRKVRPEKPDAYEFQFPADTGVIQEVTTDDGRVLVTQLPNSEFTPKRTAASEPQATAAAPTTPPTTPMPQAPKTLEPLPFSGDATLPQVKLVADPLLEHVPRITVHVRDTSVAHGIKPARGGKTVSPKRLLKTRADKVTAPTDALIEPPQAADALSGSASSGGPATVSAATAPSTSDDEVPLSRSTASVAPPPSYAAVAAAPAPTNPISALAAELEKGGLKESELPVPAKSPPRGKDYKPARADYPDDAALLSGHPSDARVWLRWMVRDNCGLSLSDGAARHLLTLTFPNLTERVYAGIEMAKKGPPPREGSRPAEQHKDTQKPKRAPVTKAPASGEKPGDQKRKASASSEKGAAPPNSAPRAAQAQPLTRSQRLLEYICSIPDRATPREREVLLECWLKENPDV